MNSGVWIPDHATRQCYKCGTPFGLLLRRHHCRVCGRISAPTAPSLRRPSRRDGRSGPRKAAFEGLWTWATANDHVVVGSPPPRAMSVAASERRMGNAAERCVGTTSERRVCRDCGNHVDDTLRHEDVIRIFECLMGHGVGPVEWRPSPA